MYPPLDRPFMRLEGFKVCTCLNKATFFTDLALDLPSGEKVLNSETAPQLVRLIDYTARIVNSLNDPTERGYIREKPKSLKI
jgi:hypothetical protein